VKFLRKAIFGLVSVAIVAAIARSRLESIAPIAKRMLLPFRVSALMAKPADTRLSMPLRNVRVARVADTWHATRSGGRRHEGQDLFAPSGTPVYSATHGFVIRIGDGGIGGNAVSVAGAGRRIYYYAHLSRFAPGLHVGDEVTEQTILGYVGNTGNARTTPPHLHFGVYGPNGALNPLPLLTAPSYPS
jgi:murein DD-endopeptidase MepM/ murein hydrolase activator NlpD